MPQCRDVALRVKVPPSSTNAGINNHNECTVPRGSIPPMSQHIVMVNNGVFTYTAPLSKALYK